jgi:hypothetical protein
MKEIIIRFIEESIKGSHYDKALQCLQELRKGCIKEDEAQFFNDFIY